MINVMQAQSNQNGKSMTLSNGYKNQNNLPRKPMSKRRKKIRKAQKKHRMRKQEKLIETKLQKNQMNQMITKNILEDPIRKGKKGRIFIKNLIVDINEKLLRKLLKKFGKIEEVSIPLNPTNNLAKGFAFVEFSNQFEAIKAIKELHNSMYKGRKITMKFAVDKRMYNGGTQASTETGPKIMDIEEEKEKEDDEQENDDVKDNNIVEENVEAKDEENNTEEDKKKEENYLEIEAGDDDEDNEKINENVIEEEEEEQNLPQRDQNEDMSSTIFLRNVDYESTEGEIKKRFTNWGKVLYVKLVYDSLGDGSSHRGVGFVKFEKSEIAQKLIKISRELEEDPLKADELDPNNWLEFNTKQIKMLPALKKEKIIKMREDENQKVDLNKIRKSSALRIVSLDPKDSRNMSLAKLGLPVFENNLKVFMKLKGKSMGIDTKGVEKIQLKWRENHLQEKVNKMRNTNYKLNPKRIVFKGISKDLTHDQIRLHLISVLSEKGYMPEKLQKKLSKNDKTDIKKATIKQLQTIKLFKQLKVMKDPLKKNKSRGIVFVEFMDAQAAKLYMTEVKEPECYNFFESQRKFLPIIEFTFMDMRTEKKMKGIREKMKKNAQSNDPKFKLVSDFKKKITDSKETQEKTKKPAISDEERLKLRKKHAKEHAIKCFKLLTEATESKDNAKGIEAKKAINRLKSRGKRQRFLKKLYSVFDVQALAKKKTKRIKKADTKNGEKKVIKKKIKKIVKKPPPKLKLDKESKQELDSIFDKIKKIDVPQNL